MKSAPVTRIATAFATSVVVAAGACLVLLVAPTGGAAAGTVPVSAPAPGASLGTSPAGRLTVLIANVAEYLNPKDDRQPQDLSNFARRAKQVLSDERARGTAVYVPDVILLQEVDRATAGAVRNRVSTVFGQRYAIAGTAATEPARGDFAVVHRGTKARAKIVRATAVLYDTATMNAPSAASLITFRYPKTQVWSTRACPRTSSSCQARMWESRQSAIFRMTSKLTGRTYAVTSVHFVPYRFLRPTLTKAQQPGFRQAAWLRRLRATITARYPGATQIVGGDFNEYLCSDDAAHVGQPQCDGTLQYTPLFRAALAVSYNSAIGSGIDHIFSPARVVSSGKDTTYKLFANTTTPAGRQLTPSVSAYLDAADYAQRFGSQAAFNRCDAKYDAGAANSAAARAIPGCATRYYSDHAFDWAVLG